MHLWRVSEFADLSGEGGFRRAGRWSSGGRHVVYAAEHSALALLELLAQWGIGAPPTNYQLIDIFAPDDCAITAYSGSRVPNSRKDSMAWGDNWLAEGAAPLAKVPSALAPNAYNYLINPAHSDARRITVEGTSRHVWDVRLFR